MAGMLLRNYYNLMAALTLGIKSTDTTVFGDGNINTKTRSGGIKALDGISATGYLSTSLGLGFSKFDSLTDSGLYYGSVVFGAGDTPVTFEDYALASLITSGLSKGNFASGTPSYDSSTKKWSNTLSLVLTNTSTASIVIKEVGILLPIYNYNPGSLVYREVLSTPSRLPPVRL